MLDPNTTWLSFERYLLCAARSQPDPATFEPVTRHEATRAIALALNDAQLRRSLLRLWSDARSPSAVAGEVQVRSWLEAMLFRPAAPLVLWRRRLPGLQGELPAVGAPPLIASNHPAPDDSVWLEFEVLYDDASGASGASYRLEGPADPQAGKLDRYGYAYYSPVDPGSYRAIFDGPPEEPPLDKGWLDIEVMDTTGAPLAGALYQLKLSNGQTRKGVLDQNGRVLIAGIPEGEHEITFPMIDKSSVQSNG